MALPQPSYDQVVSRAPRSPAWFGQLMAFALTLLILSVAAFLGITFGYAPYLQGRVNALDAQIADFSKRVPAEEQANIATFYSQLANLKVVLGKHAATSAFFRWLETATTQQTQLTKVSMNATSRQIQITGISRTANDVAGQIATFQKQPGVARVDFKSSQAVAGGVQFDVVVTVVQGFFTAAAQGQTTATNS